jgi:hypothetical protein
VTGPSSIRHEPRRPPQPEGRDPAGSEPEAWGEAPRWRGAADGLWVLAPLILVGALLLILTGAFSASSGPASRIPGAMFGMDMSPAAGARRAPGLGQCTASICPILRPGPNELSVAGELGSALAAVWVTPGDGGLQGRLELLNPNMGPVAEPVMIAGSSSRRACGPGCWTFALAGAPATLALAAEQRGHRYSLQLPIRWQQGASARARSLLDRAITSMQALPGVSVAETLTSGPPGEIEKIHYRLSAPDRMAYSVNTGARVIIVKGTEWSSTPGHGWQSSVYGGGGASTFDTRNWYDWGRYDQSIQLLDEHESDGRISADLALMSPALPVWFRLHLDVGSGRVSQVGMVAGGHFMSDSYSQYGVAQQIVPPRR